MPTDPKVETSVSFPLSPWDLELFAQARAFIQAAGLPKEALIPACQAVAMFQALKKRCEAQYNLPVDERRKLIQSRDTLNPAQVEWVTAFARDMGIPLDCTWGAVGRGGFIKGATAAGWRLKAQADPRLLASATSEIVERGTWNTPAVPYVTARATVTFHNGESYQALGTADGNGRQTKQGTDRSGRQTTPGDYALLPSLAETRAFNRAFKMALRLSLAGGDEDDGTPEVEVRSEPQPESLRRLLGEAALKPVSLDPKANLLSIAATLGYPDEAAICKPFSAASLDELLQAYNAMEIVKLLGGAPA